jgi:mannose-6-phosphate isomerase-like protein (cupin superfamily)
VTTLVHPTAAEALGRRRHTRHFGPSTLQTIARSFVPEVRARRFGEESSVRSWVLLAQSEDYETWVIGWPPGGSIELHDHGHSLGAVVVVSGELLETKIVPLRDNRVATLTTNLSAGDTVELKSHCIHDVVNVSSVNAVSIHVYSPRLTSMTYYEIDDGILDAVRTVEYCSSSDREH